MKDRLTKEINYWDFRAEQLKDQERAGKANARLNSGEARKRADELQARLQKRMEEIKRERQLAPLPPVVLGGLLVVPAGLLHAMSGGTATPSARTDTQAAAARARAIIMEVERSLGFLPVDREIEKLGYDIESAIPGTGKAAVYRGEGPCVRRIHNHGDAQRDPWSNPRWAKFASRLAEGSEDRTASSLNSSAPYDERVVRAHHRAQRHRHRRNRQDRKVRD